jgi:putative flippase GtrA
VPRFLRYTASSLLATVTSAVTFALVYRVLDGGPQLAGLTAFVPGAIVNFVANRFWAWRLRERTGLGREALSYAVVAVLCVLAATGVAGLTHAALQDVDPDLRAVLVELSYLGTYAVLFLLKYVVLDRLVFRTKHRNHVDTTTPA